MSQSIAIAKTDLGSLIKVRQFDSEDYEVTVTGVANTPTLFASVSGGVERAMNRAAEVNGLKIAEVVFDRH
ncbi:hypothetical protein ACTG16_22750 [Aeromonas sp. 23P]|uniref:hypothetical protein n=1 Tax=Aeromonas sp. 23P TaxID=3452716 RepID=UPI003F7AFA82|nr:hypothetical protein [Aeromonas veronii]